MKLTCKMITPTHYSSSNVVAMGYCQEESVLVVDYKSDEGHVRRYLYTKIPKLKYKKLKTSESWGKYLNEHIKKKSKYKCLSIGQINNSDVNYKIKQVIDTKPLAQ